ncbi:MAG TPA: hypothetical protein VFP80_17095, partial [Thermoanaerobaculia bacterium]|nr:hypothetical protein [Thermoanaerobaculia bacterium]
RQSSEAALTEPPLPLPEPLVVSDNFAEFREEYDQVVPEVFRHMPLATWARMESWRTQPADAADPQPDDVRELIAALALPAHVAGVAYPRGCRIRRVRVPGGKKRTPRGAQTVILSRRALDEVRSAPG